MADLRIFIDAYLKHSTCWREHPEHTGTDMHWEDLLAEDDEPRTLPTELAAVRHITREAEARRSRPIRGHFCSPDTPEPREATPKTP